MSLDDDALSELLDGLGIELRLNSVAPDIEPLLDALIRRAPKAALEQAAADGAPRRCGARSWRRSSRRSSGVP